MFHHQHCASRYSPSDNYNRLHSRSSFPFECSMLQDSLSMEFHPTLSLPPSGSLSFLVHWNKNISLTIRTAFQWKHIFRKCWIMKYSFRMLFRIRCSPNTRASFRRKQQQHQKNPHIHSNCSSVFRCVTMCCNDFSNENYKNICNSLRCALSGYIAVMPWFIEHLTNSNIICDVVLDAKFEWNVSGSTKLGAW